MTEKRQNQSYYIWIVYLNVVLYATCYQLQRPLEPFLVEKLKQGGSASDVMQEYATLQSFFSILQTLGSLISGKFVDIFGVKGGFYISFGASALCYAFLAQATTLRMLYISKIPTIFQAGFLCAQVAASQLTNDGPERVKALGLLTTSYTIGSVIGPSIGGMLGASGDYYFGAKLAVVGSILSIFLTFLMPNTSDESSAKPTKSVATTAPNPSSPWNLHSIWEVLSVVWIFLTTKVISSTANAMSMTAFPIILKNHYGVDEQGLGFAMSFLSACNAIVNGLLLEPIVKSIGKGNLMVVITTCLVAMTALFALQGSIALPILFPYFPATAAYTLYTFLASSVFLSIFQYVLATTITSESTARVNADAKGTLLGLEHSLFSAARIITPQIGISLLQQGGISYVSYTCAMVYAVVTVVWYVGKDMCGPGKTPGSVTQEWKEK